MFPKGVYSLKSFLQNLAWGREPKDRTRMPNFTIVALKCGRTAPKIAKNGNFFVKICPSGKILGVDRKT